MSWLHLKQKLTFLVVGDQGLADCLPDGYTRRGQLKGQNQKTWCMFNLLSLIPRLLHRKMGREPGRFNHVPRDVVCMVLCVVLITELLPTQSDSKYCPALKNAIVVAGTYGSAVLLFKLLAGYSKFSFHQGIVAPRLFSGFYNERSRRSLSESAGCCSL